MTASQREQAAGPGELPGDADVRALTGRVAVVTGGGRGLGRAIALALAEARADVTVAARSAEEIRRVAGEVEGRGRRSLDVPTDIKDEEAVERLIGCTVDELGGLDILVNNSGVVHMAPLLETSPEEWDRVVATNLRGTYLCMRAVGRHFAGKGSGKVINVSSNLAFKGRPRFSAYSASKAAIAALTRTVAVEWARFGAQVNAVAPGYVETDMNAELRRDKELYARVVNQIPARRMARAQEIGPLVVYLASPASDFMTGETIVIDGGEIAK
jgi:NAD(P)-dependent dehydrogenase (short-subunit alcohol dehydrogenase family)